MMTWLIEDFCYFIVERGKWVCSLCRTGKMDYNSQVRHLQGRRHLSNRGKHQESKHNMERILTDRHFGSESMMTLLSKEFIVSCGWEIVCILCKTGKMDHKQKVRHLQGRRHSLHRANLNQLRWDFHPERNKQYRERIESLGSTRWQQNIYDTYRFGFFMK